MREEVIGKARLILGDCRDVLPTLPKVDAVVTDPPYGIGADKAAKAAAELRKANLAKPKGERSKAGKGWADYGDTNWDAERPDAEVMRLAIAAGKHAIVWGGNYFPDIIPPIPKAKWLVWDKGQEGFSLADCEFAWCSFEGAIRRKFYARASALQDGKEHPTQKALAVMRWCIDQLPGGCATIIDPFLGSGTTGVAAVQMGRDFIGIERELAYFDIACRRIEQAQRQGDLFIQGAA